MFKKHASRVGCHSTKIMFSINVKSVILPLDTAIQNGAVLSICFERGGKISSTSNKDFDMSDANKLTQKDGTLIISFPVEERVELIATLYKDTKTNQYQDKSSKLILRQLKKNSVFNLDSYKGLGVHNLSLNNLANDMGFDTSYATSTLRLPLDLLPAGYFLEVVIAATVLKTHNSYTDDNRSVMSSLSQGSDASMIGASFENSSSKSAVSPGAASFARGGDGTGHGLFQSKKFGVGGGSGKHPQQDYLASNYSIQEVIAEGVEGAEGGQTADREDNENEEEEDYDVSTLQLDPEKIEYCSEEVRVEEELQEEEEESEEERKEEEKSLEIENEHQHQEQEQKQLTGEEGSPRVAESVAVDDNSTLSPTSSTKSAKRSPRETESSSGVKQATLSPLQPPQPSSTTFTSSSSTKSKGSRTNPNTPSTASNTTRVTTSRAMSVDAAGRGQGLLFDSDDDPAGTDSTPLVVEGEVGNSTASGEEDGEKEEEDVEVTYDESGQIEVDKKLLSWNVTKGDTPRDRQRKKKANREAFTLYTAELANKNRRIQELERELRNESRAHGLQVLELQTKLTVAQRSIDATRDREKSSREILTAAYDKADSKIAEQLSSARDETSAIAAEYARTAAELHLATADVLYYKNLSEAALKEKREEMANAQEAATVAVKACLRRADLLQENEDLLEELIDTKVKFANAAYELDAELRKNLAAKKRLQYYAEQFAALEIKFMHSTDSVEAITPRAAGEE